MSVQTLSASFPVNATVADNFVAMDPHPVLADYYYFPAGDPTGCQRTLGALRVVPIPIQPNLTEVWTILGFSARMQVAGPFYAPGFQQAKMPFGELGAIWLGLALDAMLTNRGGLNNATVDRVAAQPVQFPQDLSTFTVVAPPEMPRPVLADLTGFGYVIPTQGPGGLVGVTYMLPAPFQLRPGGQLQMALIAMPSKIGRPALSPARDIVAPASAVFGCDFTVIYDNNAGGDRS